MLHSKILFVMQCVCAMVLPLIHLVEPTTWFGQKIVRGDSWSERCSKEVAELLSFCSSKNSKRHDSSAMCFHFILWTHPLSFHPPFLVSLL